jgi:hypothetical protein
MIPFGISLFLMLGSFTEMYFKSTYGTDTCTDETSSGAGFCSYGSAFLTAYSMFVGGIDGGLLTTETETNLLILTIIYGFLFVIVMLNILVAVVFDAWGRVSPRGHQFFWYYRHQFLVETTETNYLRVYDTLSSRKFNALEDHLNAVLERFSSRPKRATDANTAADSCRESALYLIEGFYLLVWFLLGLVTAGALWCKKFRQFAFSFEGEEIEDPSEEPDDAMEKLSEAQEELQMAREQLATSQNQLDAALNAIQDLKDVLFQVQRQLSPSESSTHS